MVRCAVEDGVWDVVMIAFHMMHQNARTQVFPRTIANRVGTLLMFAVRNIFSRPERLAVAVRELTAKRSATALARRRSEPARLPDPCSGREHDHRGGLSLCAPPAGCRCRSLRHRRPGSFAREHRFCAGAAAPPGGSANPHQAVRPSCRSRARPALQHARARIDMTTRALVSRCVIMMK